MGNLMKRALSGIVFVSVLIFSILYSNNSSSSFGILVVPISFSPSLSKSFREEILSFIVIALIVSIPNSLKATSTSLFDDSNANRVLDKVVGCLEKIQNIDEK